MRFLWMLFGGFSFCLFTYGMLWTVMTAAGGLACVIITGIIYEEYEL